MKEFTVLIPLEETSSIIPQWDNHLFHLNDSFGKIDNSVDCCYIPLLG